MNKRDLLLEIGVEEIPARFIDDGVAQLAEGLTRWLEEQRISFGSYRTFATPRRMAVLIEDVAERQHDLEEEVRGPAQRIAMDEDGNWTRAAEGFARKQGLSPEELQLAEYKGEMYVFAHKRLQGQDTSELLLSGLPSVLRSLHFPNAMRWGSGRTRFIRPVRWLVCLLGEEQIPVEWAGKRASNRTRGHRFLGQEILLATPAAYQDVLKEEWVIADVAERREMILDQLRELEQKYQFQIPIEEGLINEVTHLVEYPTALLGGFHEDFLSLPKAVLITTMREHQRYFPVETADGTLLPYFITIRNGNENASEQVIKGNEKVLQARLADARFFYEADQKLSVDEAVKRLNQVVFHEELGTVGERTRRIAAVAGRVAEQLQLDAETMEKVERSAAICKFDLSTQMIDEFPELEGIMGEEYARQAGEDPEVAEGIREHHLPRFSGDDLPAGVVGAVIGVADKMDTVASFFAIGMEPTGSQDPYGLRRRAAGIVQILLDRDWQEVSLDLLISLALDRLEAEGLLRRPRADVSAALESFFVPRMKAVLQEKGIRYDVVDAVLAAGTAHPHWVVEKAQVLAQRMEEEEFKSIAEGLIRAANLARQQTEVHEIDPAYFTNSAEQNLLRAIQTASEAVGTCQAERDAAGLYDILAQMAPAIHQFFDEVMVMAEEEEIRANRLALLHQVTALTKQFAHFDKLVFS